MSLATPKQSMTARYVGEDASRGRHESAVSLPHRVQPSGRGLSVLSFDGGGYRGYGSLLILRNILRRLQPEGKLYPYLYFDLICGTSTGGLIAILLAVLHLDMDTAMEVYVMLAKSLFGSHLRSPRYLLQDEKFNSKLLMKTMSHILDRYSCGRTLMEDPKFDKGCRCFVTAAYRDQADTQVILVRSYPPPPGIDSIPAGYQWTIMDAAMATAAAPTYFRNRSITANDHRFIFEDAGAHGANNPTMKAWVELKAWAKLEPDGGPSCFVSIGTGGNKMAQDSPTSPRNGTARRILNNLFNARLRAKELSRGLLYQATDVEEVDELMKSHTKGTDKSYYRFNPPQLGSTSFTNHNAIPKLQRAVYAYQLDHKQLLKECSYQIDTAPSAFMVSTPGKLTKRRWQVPILNQCWS